MKVVVNSADTPKELEQKKVIRDNIAIWHRDRQRRATRLSLKDKSSTKFSNVGETAKITNENNNKVRPAGLHLHTTSKPKLRKANSGSS